MSPAAPTRREQGSPPRRSSDEALFLPTTRAHLSTRGWSELDVLIVTGDAYVDHPAFGPVLIARLLEGHGYKVGLVAQPDWTRPDDLARMGRPRLFVGVGAGNLDSMLSKLTAQKKPRSVDPYSPGGAPGMRPDRATIVYANLCRAAFPGLPVVLGGIEASLRRVAHYDYWSDAVRRSILLDSKADLLVFGMGEVAVLEIARRLDAGEPLGALRDVAGTAHVLHALSLWRPLCEPPSGASGEVRPVVLPSFEQVRTDKRAFAEMTRRLALESSPYCGRPMLQPHGDQAVFLNPPSRPLREDEMDALYDLPFQRRAHPGYAEDVPALETVRHSVVTLRGCFGGCSFCSISEHEGRVIQSRSGPGVLREVERLRRVEGFAGVVTDLGGPTANMYAMECKDEAAKRACRKPSCLHPSMCARLGDDHGPLLDLLRAVRAAPGVKRVFLASGIRCDLANRSPEFVRELAAHHTGGQLSVAPEHSDPKVLAAMRKPPIEEYDRFARTFLDASRSAGKEQYLVPYLISGHPGSTLEDTVELALALKARGLRPRQVQDFIPTPMSVATAMYHTGFDPTSGASVPTATDLRTKRMMKALLLYWDKESWPLAREALVRAGRRDLIGRGAHCLVPPDYGASASTPRGPQRHVRRARSS